MKLASAIAFSLVTASPALAAAGRLPTGVVPVLYDIRVRPDATALSFAGDETITVDVRQPTRTLVLNAVDLAITRATFDGKPASVALDAAAQTVTVTLPAPAKVGRHLLDFAWTGTINRSAAGLFAIDYSGTDGKQHRMLATQFEAPDARRFAPMWDEPAFKARFRLSSTAPAGQRAFSNMPATISTTPGGEQLYRFAETPVMSSYLLFLGQGEMERKTARVGKVELGIISRLGVVDQGDYALAAAKRLLPYYDDYFGQPYPLPKLDMIAGPGSSQFFGAMENWGAIFYFEPELLFDPSRTTTSAKQRIHVVVAHEMAHQWFGDLVTMRWWNDLWLNEGFASWMESKAGADLNPEWQVKASLVANDRERAMVIDATSGTHPIIRPIASVDQIGEAFDGITYAKGQAVIGMLEATLGADTFRNGIRRYMAKYRYGNTVTDQLWAELSAASGRDVRTIARDFTVQGGVPLVTMTGATCAKGVTTATLTQTRFGLDAASKVPLTWHVPLSVATLGRDATQTIVTGSAPTSVTIQGCGTVVLNRGKASYTRVMYDAPGHAAIVRDYPKLALEDRIGTLTDDYALAAGGYQDLGRYFAVQARVGDAASPLEWSTVTDRLEALAGLYAGTPLEQPLRARTVSMLSPVLARIGLTTTDNESALTSNLREDLVALLGVSGDTALAARARDYVARLRTDPTAIPPAIRKPILATYAANATATEWDQLLALTRAERTPVAKNRFVQLLGMARDEDVARRALALLTGATLSDPQKASLLRAIADAHPALAFNWAVTNRTLVEGFIEESSRPGFIVGLLRAGNDPAISVKVRAFAAASPASASGPTVERTLAGIAARRATADRLRAAIATWLASPVVS